MNTVKVQAQTFDNIFKHELAIGKMAITSRLRTNLDKFFRGWAETSVMGAILHIDDERYMESYDSNVFALLSVTPLRETLCLHIAHLRQIAHTDKTKTSGRESPMFDENYSFLKKGMNILNGELEKLKSEGPDSGAELKMWAVLFASQIGLLRCMAIRANNKQP